MSKASSTTSVHAISVPATLSIREAQRALAAHGAEVRASPTSLFARMEGATLVVHDFGVVVLFGAAPELRKRIVRALQPDGEREATETIDETFLIEQSDAPRVAAQFDRIVTPRVDDPFLEIVAVAIGQSTALDRYELAVDASLREVDTLVAQLEARGTPRGSLRNVRRFIGRTLRLRNRVVMTLALLDAPASTWDDERLDRASRELRQTFALDDRFRTLEHKLAMIRDTLSIVTDLAQSRHTIALEAAVAIMIAVEVILFLIK